MSFLRIRLSCVVFIIQAAPPPPPRSSSKVTQNVPSGGDLDDVAELPQDDDVDGLREWLLEPGFQSKGAVLRHLVVHAARRLLVRREIEDVDSEARFEVLVGEMNGVVCGVNTLSGQQLQVGPEVEVGGKVGLEGLGRNAAPADVKR